MLNRCDLGPDGTSYVMAYLEANGECGKQLGPLLVAGHDIDAGSAWAFVPSPIPLTRRAPLTAFEAGGLFPARDHTREDQTRGWFRSLSESSSADVVCVEAALERPSDPFLAKLDAAVFYCGESVVYFGRLNSRTYERFLGGAIWKPDVAIVTRAPLGGLTDRSSVEPHDLAYLANETVAVVIGAWDEEGLIVWEPDER